MKNCAMHWFMMGACCSIDTIFIECNNINDFTTMSVMRCSNELQLLQSFLFLFWPDPSRWDYSRIAFDDCDEMSSDERLFGRTT